MKLTIVRNFLHFDQIFIRIRLTYYLHMNIGNLHASSDCRTSLRRI